jgi:UDPglucose 6-dehydrogenase
MVLGIIGYGYVGGAIGHLCKKNNVPFATYDVIRKDEREAELNTDSISELVNFNESDHVCAPVYFICVPTPPDSETGECDTTIVEKVIGELSQLVSKSSCVIIKSTVRPGTTRKLSDKYANENLSIVFCPEFLREKTFTEDMYNAQFALIGTTNSENSVAETTLKLLYKHNDSFRVITKSAEECELFKYTINVFLSVKVWYFNELSLICDKFNVKYSDFQQLFTLEPRIGESHTDVPGHDGKRGFGGKCLPKETKAMCHLQKTLGLDNTVLQRILERNSTFRDDV